MTGYELYKIVGLLTLLLYFFGLTVILIIPLILDTYSNYKNCEAIATVQLILLNFAAEKLLLPMIIFSVAFLILSFLFA